jgi:hypothetical protein
MNDIAKAFVMAGSGIGTVIYIASKTRNYIKPDNLEGNGILFFSYLSVNTACIVMYATYNLLDYLFPPKN